MTNPPKPSQPSSDAGRKRGLGGQGFEVFKPSVTAPPAPTPQSRTLFQAPIESLRPRGDQPRTHFDEDALNELAQSIREHGVLEPILVRKHGADGYEIIAGERRWRASQRAGLHEVPVHLRELNDNEAFEVALVENLQREDLNAIEVARGYDRLAREYGYSQERIAERVGKSRVAVTNALRILKLPEAVLDLVLRGDLSEGHARALLGAPDAATMLRLAATAAAEQLSVREIEQRVRRLSGAAKSSSGPTAKESANHKDLEARLTRTLGAKTSILDNKGKGKIEIAYTSANERERLLERLFSSR